MPMSTASAQSLALLLFNATAWANIADNAASAPLTNIAVALHTADPGVGGTMATSEATYTSYARASVARTSGGFSATGGVVSPVANIDFPTGTGGGGSATHASFGKTGGGAALFLVSGPVTPNIAMGNGITPRLTTASVITVS